MWTKIGGTVLLATLSFNTFALPILSESADGTGVLATIYPDHEDQNKFYFLPNTGGLEKNENGVPRFGMHYKTTIASPEETAGFFNGIFRLSLSHDLKTSVENYRKAKKQIAVVPVQKSHLEFMQDREGNRVFEELYKQVSMPSVSGRPDDSFGISATLTEFGAQTFSSILLDGGSAASLNYCYQIKGVSPIFETKIELNYNKVYSHFVAQARGGRLWWKWSVRKEVEKLVEDGEIIITITGGTANQYDVIMSLADRMVTKFMVPQLENRRTAAAGRFGLAQIDIIEDRTQTLHLKQRELIERDFCVSLGLDEVKAFPWLITKK